MVHISHAVCRTGFDVDRAGKLFRIAASAECIVISFPSRARCARSLRTKYFDLSYYIGFSLLKNMFAGTHGLLPAVGKNDFGRAVGRDSNGVF